MKTFILTEKPDVARSFKKALNATKRPDNFFESEQYIIGFASGHLVEAYKPFDYNIKFKKWDLNDLPFIPEKFLFKIIKGKEKLFFQIKKALEECSNIIIATDAGREGELIARLILKLLDNKKPVFRFWTSQTLTPEIINLVLKKNIKSAQEYDRVYLAAMYRLIADWIVGLNFTPLITLKVNTYGELFSIGRVQTAVLNFLYERKKHIENFISQNYFRIETNFYNNQNEYYKGEWINPSEEKNEKLFDKKRAQEIIKKIEEKPGNILSIKTTRKKINPPPLYSLASLQIDANKKYGYSTKKTLEIAQQLYEPRLALISYPRTQADALGENGVTFAKKICIDLNNDYPNIFKNINYDLFKTSYQIAFDNKRLTDHFAIIPLKSAKNKNLNIEQKNIYNLIMKRFSMVFHDYYEYDSTQVITIVENEHFLSYGQKIINYGWRYLALENINDSIIPNFVKKNLNVLSKNSQLFQEKTKPLPHHSQGSLTEAMLYPQNYMNLAGLDHEQSEEYKKILKQEKGIGSPSTQANIIDILLTRNYAENKKNKIIISSKGEFLIDLLMNLSQKIPDLKKILSPIATAEWEYELNQISAGYINYKKSSFLKEVKKFVIQTVSDIKNHSDITFIDNSKESLGECPKCKKDIYETNRSYKCSNCDVFLWKKFCKANITKKDIKDLLSGKETKEKKFKNKQDKEFIAKLTLKKENDKILYTFLFDNIRSDKEYGICPKCKAGKIIKTTFGFICNQPKERCNFIIFKEIAHKKITEDILSDLINNKKTKHKIEGFKSKDNKMFSCFLKLNSNYEVCFSST